MWDWELLRNNSGKHMYHICSSYKDENFQYTHSVSCGSQEDEFCLHNHALYELEYYLSGDVVYVVDGVRYEMQPGSILLIAPTVLHKLFINSEASFERHILYISLAGNMSLTSALARECLPSEAGHKIGCAFYSPEMVADIKPLFDEMEACAHSEDRQLNDLVPVFVQAVLAKLKILGIRNVPTMHRVSENRTMDTVKQYLNTHIAQSLSLQDVADRFHLSKDYCNRLFRKTTGMSIVQYIKYNRILMARQIMAEGATPSDAAKQVGFGDYSSFYRAYKDVTGRTPREDHQL